VVVPGGSFGMGTPENAEDNSGDEGPQHDVTIPSAFAVGKYEVTFDEWNACVVAGGCGGHRPDDRGWGRSNRPVIYMSWADAQSYVSWLAQKTRMRYRLLSESEWEYVARAGTTTHYSWGYGIGVNKANCVGCGSNWDLRWHDRKTAPVGSFAANDLGLYDMAGNVAEWTEDCWHGGVADTVIRIGQTEAATSGAYVRAPLAGEVWRSGGNCNLRVLRGGSWSNLPWLLRSSSRNKSPKDIRLKYNGFRVARTLDG